MSHAKVTEELLSLAGSRDSEEFAAGSIPAVIARELLSPGELGVFLCNPLVRFPQVRVAMSGRAVAAGDYVTSRRIGTRSVEDGIDGLRVAEWLTKGATVTLDSLEYLSKPVARICESLSDALGLTATATAYVTPPGKRGLSPHTDEEDVFVLQTYGTKNWIVDSAQRQETATAAGFPFNDQMKQVAPVTLRPGDMFFMPAGTPHVAAAQADLSIHITISVERPRLKHLLEEAVATAVSVYPELNRLQRWSAAENPSATTLLELVARVSSTAVPARISIAPSALPFDSWDSLDSARLSVRLIAPMKVTQNLDSYTLAFPDFRITLNGATGRSLAGLSMLDWTLVEPGDGECREVLFQLIGRGVIEATGATA
ncbi:JmjC domain-containing protein [Leifsonia sp. NCR5]|uniref:JmjC domain-containing protein n=1 Tax=Leifsonia sp. NCR5 TaxID=1978342 RepID=UPI000A190347|nr:cupin domain-containing protein [Leifsonia sp. NCR5]